jgi:hypothetical protein
MAEQVEPAARAVPDTSAPEGAAPEELHLYFPIEVEVRAVETVHDADAAAERALGRLARSIRSAG